MEVDASPPTPWWGSYTLDLHTAACWSVGPAVLWVYRTPQDWRVLYRSTGDPMHTRSDVQVPADVDTWHALEEQAGEDPTLIVHRHGFRSTPAAAAVEPVTADRPIVVRPEHPLSIPAGEEVTLYLSIPLWIRVRVGDTVIEDVPSHRPSDTWFGASTREGELCYATRTAGRVNLANVPMRMHRAVTPLRIRNRADDRLQLERVHVPAPYLGLYHAQTSDHIWTEALTLTREKSGSSAAVDIRPGAPPDVSEAAALSDPRSTSPSGLVVSTFRAIEGLFGAG